MKDESAKPVAWSLNGGHPFTRKLAAKVSKSTERAMKFQRRALKLKSGGHWTRSTDLSLVDRAAL